ncbi:MAG: extracellular solute-binding protein [Treponema sp.]|nr:extracellular solute-binding protein [Treponema sp.]
MKNLIKAAIPALLMVCLVLPVYAAGGSQQPQSNRAAELAAIGFQATGFPVVTKPFTFSAVVNRGPMHGPFSEMEAHINMEKQTGITVNFIEIPSQSFNERKNLMLASNDLPDVFISGVSDPDILKYGGSGTLIPLEGLIDQYGPNLKDLFAKRPDIRRDMVTPDGHMFTLPRLQELAHRVNPDNWFINNTWLTKLGLALPTTKDELLNVYRAFKDKDPNGNGKKDEIPFSFMGGTIGGQFDIASLFGAFGMNDVTNHVMVNNGKVYFTANSQSFKDACAYFNQMYSEGLIDPEVFTQTNAEYFAKGTQPDNIMGSFIGWFDENNVGVERAKADYVCLPPLIGTDGKQHWNTDANALLARANFAITSAMKYPEVAIRWGDLCFDWSHSMELCYGPWGICLVQEGDKIIQLPPPPGLSQDEFRYLHCPAAESPFAVYEADHRNLNLAENHVRKFARLDIYRPCFPAPEELFPRAFFLPEEENELAVIRTDINDFVAQSRARFITGADSVNTGWDTYVSRLNQMGLARYLEIHQQALDRYNKSK